MILYFSGTGNSAHVANRIAAQIGDKTLNLFDRIKEKNHESIASDKPWVIVVPTYAWQIPHIVRDWLLSTELTGSKKAYFVMTCGDSIGNAEAHNRALCEKKGWQHLGTAKPLTASSTEPADTFSKAKSCQRTKLLCWAKSSADR